ncbi:taurine catabolism dioxygenase TauD, TfdA family protein [Aspergillus steynii IBT 23096]|uniref:Taurine catabolism dioxygenase TauD, TfdA family protein n=1 Tax=Aspergillus steynii IBT 23096 TaxID=1392250 RepID=A0A2I2FZU9_9EURO|nr:taurine catabolism dioxygenase TauD, TfdA family protein [Aspergillus steynii IBT 23096]PLB46157.1 taurine catabolism dioxygenase TauD, TfdA family protein [Aspergillus steynii IBT 23096]
MSPPSADAYPVPEGSLDEYESFDLTSAIGREFSTLQLSEILHDDTKIRDLGITVSQRGVVFLRNQDLNIADQKTLAIKIGQLTGRPEASYLHKHPLSNGKRRLAVDKDGKVDDEVTIMSSEQNKKMYKGRFALLGITFEPVPSDYAILKIVTPPEDAGGDTLWASGYEAFDRLSPAWKKFAEGLTATHYQPAFNDAARDQNMELITENRGNPENSGVDFKVSHPVVRTNPVTGWKSLFAAGFQIRAGWIDDVTEYESEMLKSYFLKLISENHDLQVRFRWSKNDIAIWDNRSVFHTATYDYNGARVGNRVVSLGERPFYDPNSISRREALGLDA